MSLGPNLANRALGRRLKKVGKLSHREPVSIYKHSCAQHNIASSVGDDPWIRRPPPNVPSGGEFGRCVVRNGWHAFVTFDERDAYRLDGIIYDAHSGEVIGTKREARFVSKY